MKTGETWEMNDIPWFQADGFGNMLMWFYIVSSEAREVSLKGAGASDDIAGISYTAPEPIADGICKSRLHQRIIEQNLRSPMVAIDTQCEIEKLLEREGHD